MLACLVVAVLAAWWALVHRGAARVVGAAAAAVSLAGAVVLIALEGRVLEDVLILAGLALSIEAARRVFTVHARLPAASAPKRAVLFYNPKSGGGKAERFGSLGVYAEGVQREGYRDAKLRTIAETMPTVLGPGGEALDLRWTGSDGREHKTSAVVLVSNDPYRLGRAIASGTRPRLDAGVLGITVLGAEAAGSGESACRSGPRHRSRSAPIVQSRPASTARP